MQTAHRTDAGLIRLINEDRAAVRDEWNGFTLAIVADGMGGHQAGEIASQMAIELVETEMKTVVTDMTVEERKDAVRSAIAKANDTVFEFASKQARYQGMGTTVVTALATSYDLVIGHIGDSRAYLVSGDSIRQLTEDHSLVNELVKSGQITPEEANVHPLRNVVTRALGTDKQVEVDVIHSAWRSGDILLLCSDGLSGLVEERELHQIIADRQDLAWKVDKLVGRALEEGGGDNITVVLLANDEVDRAYETNDPDRRGGA
ncbi:Stp1/IreP family PP2C-type Ser/Thr phosphatase [Paenibacillus mesophilus]|uniref:Stp1/IreP family PP2C-type Ser/Thr phosphatase n=1 Tax=Paenibacillus mesophilus TaxID=2582849 RepID=UPI00110D4F77|nr:Stp1/IreP family PP2C-type Ser/Thr phosphatase [Paenibacillus mesophilus]TMV51888.1 Stp1/IreP family PP2C-type Ser/Thr phosphatase [Paenibacillus mesophilus]